MEAHVARGAHNTLSQARGSTLTFPPACRISLLSTPFGFRPTTQYWVVSLLMALRALESDCFGSPCTSHNVSARLHRPLMARATATAVLERARAPALTQLWEQLCGRASHLEELARLFCRRPEHALWESVQLLPAFLPTVEPASAAADGTGVAATEEGALGTAGAAAAEEAEGPVEGAARGDADASRLQTTASENDVSVVDGVKEGRGGGGVAVGEIKRGKTMEGGGAGGAGGAGGGGGGSSGGSSGRPRQDSYAYFEGVSGVERAACLAAHLEAASALLRCCESAVQQQAGAP